MAIERGKRQRKHEVQPKVVAPEILQELSTAKGRVQRTYDRIFGERFVVGDDGILPRYPLLMLEVSHPRYAEAQLPADQYQNLVSRLPKQVQPFMALIHTFEPNGFRGEIGGAANLLTDAVKLTESGVHNLANWEKYLSNHGWNFQSLGGAINDEISFLFTHFAAGDPIAHGKEVVQHGLSTEHEVDHEKTYLLEALDFVVDPGKPIKKQKPKGRIAKYLFVGTEAIRREISSDPVIDKWVDVIPAIRSGAQALLKDRPADAAKANAIALLVDSFKKIPSPGIDAPSISPYLRAEVRAKAMFATERMYQALTTPATEGASQSVQTGYEQVVRALITKHRGELQSGAVVARQLTEKALGRKLKRGEEVNLSDEQILTNPHLTDEEQDRLIMAHQIGTALHIVGEKMKAEEQSAREARRRGRRTKATPASK